MFKPMPSRSRAAIRAGLRAVLNARGTGADAKLKMRAAELLLELESVEPGSEPIDNKPKVNRLFDLFERQARKGLPEKNGSQAAEQVASAS